VTVTLPLVAVLAGLLSFASPCCLPLVPAYLSYVSALPVRELGKAEARRTALRASLLFVLGFSTVFVALGLTASYLGYLLLRNQDAITRALGVVVIVLGLASAGLLRIPLLNRERRFDMAKIPRGPAWAVPTGMAFAAGWTPCLGPTLGTILTAAAAGGSPALGAGLLFLYAFGLGIPFIALALGYQRLQGSVSFLKRHGGAIERTGGVLLVIVGILLVTGQWQELFRPLQRMLVGTGWPPI